MNPPGRVGEIEFSLLNIPKMKFLLTVDSHPNGWRVRSKVDLGLNDHVQSLREI
jgi:hypothetical protein